MLKEALLKLMQKEDIRRITVAELCETAQINRTTFYKYYENTYDLLEETEKDFFDELKKSFDEGNLSEKDMLTGTIAYIDRNRDKMKILLNALSYDSFYDHLMHQSFINTFLDQKILQNYPASETKYIRLFFSRGIYAMLREWISSRNPESQSEFVALILSIRKRFERK